MKLTEGGSEARMCDRCGASQEMLDGKHSKARYIARAKYWIVMASGSELDLCEYHYGKHELGLITMTPRPQIKSLAAN